MVLCNLLYQAQRGYIHPTPFSSKQASENLSLGHATGAEELEMHPLLLAANKSLLDVHAKYNIRTAAYSPLAPLLKHPKQGGRLKLVLDRIAERIDADAATVLLLWCKARGFIAVTTSASKERMQKLVDIEKLPQLTDEEVEDAEMVRRLRASPSRPAGTSTIPNATE